VTTSTSAAFQFASTPSGLPFECSLDGAAYAACASPRTYSGLPNGPHTFSVRAVNGGVVRDPSPATRTWTIDAQPPAISAVAAAPGLTSAVITWTTGEAGTTVVDYGTSSSALTQRASNGSLVTGHSITLNGLSQGVLYYFRVTSVDAAGNAATSPAAPESPASFRTRTSVLQSPAATVIQSGRLRSGSAGNLASDNGSTYQVNSTTSGTRTATWYASFTNVSRSLANLRISYSGSNSRTATQRIEIFRWSDGTWVTLDTRSVGSSEADLTLTPTGTLANYVSGSNGVGELRVRVRTTHSWGSFISIGDRLQISFDRP
jgi:hypothetical protein